MKIPSRFQKILEKNQTLHSIVLDVISSFEPILLDNKLYFFEEYTNHGIAHIEQVLESSEFIISEESFENISSNEVAILVLSIILHDVGMHIEFSTFKSLLNGDYDKFNIKVLSEKTWSNLWEEYLSEVKRFSSIQKKNIFGIEDIPFNIPDLSNKDKLTGYDKKLIGEFVRRHHGRFAHEVASYGLKSEKGLIEFGTNKLDEKTKQLVGILARSHSMNVRETFSYLEEIAHESWRNPHNVNIIFLMIILRIADYIQIDNSRVNPFLLKMKTFNSPISELENETHLAINSLNFNQTDKENIYVDCSPRDSEMFVKIENLIFDIQNEFDKSWAILGEIYGFIPVNKPSIKFRRISSNLKNKLFLKKLNYIPQKITFKVDNNLSKLLVAPLYGNNPTFGVRELLQNAIDACLERKEIEYENKNYKYVPNITASIERIDDNKSVFIIHDNGKGMNSDEIVNYFLSVGNSFRKSMEWKKKFISEDGKTKINRSGKFGIGVLASFLLGPEITVKTKSLQSKESCRFSASIDTQYINITREESTEDYGTTISVTISNENREKILNHKPTWNDKSIKWTSWYLYEEPKITFTVDKEKINIKSLISNIKFFEFSDSDFEKISWSYSLKGFNQYHSHLIACNGIIITEEYDSDRFEYDDEENQTSDQFVIENKPSILVTDKEGIFPVRLDRNDIDCDEFPFENRLKLETAKHFLAQLLISNTKYRSFEPSRIIHQPDLLYSNTGFILNSKYFIEGVKSSQKFIRLLTAERELNISLDKYENCLFKILFESRVNLTNQEYHVAPSGGGIMLLARNKFDSLFRSSKKRLANYITSNCSILEEDKNYVIYSMYDAIEEPSILKTIKGIEKNLLNKTESIQEVTHNLFDINDGPILSELFSKYIKNNFIIPYDIEERKELYKEAFTDLEIYMK